MVQKFKYGFLFVFLFILSACDQFGSDSTAAVSQQAAPPPVSVSSIKVKIEDIPLQYEYVGQVAGSLEVDVRSRLTGIIEQRHFTEGGEVEVGQLLFTLDAAKFEAIYKQQQATIESARAQKLTVKAQLKQARRELKRVTPLAEQNMVSQNQLDDAASAVDITTAQLAVAEAAIKLAEANLLTAKVDLDYTRIRSPIKGIVGRALQNRGALVQTGINDLLTTLVQINPVYINFGVPENDQIKLRNAIDKGTILLAKTGFVVDLLDENRQSTGRSGSLDFQDYKVDNKTGNFAMRATMKNQNAQLSPGQFVRVLLKGAVKTNAIAIPQRAVLDGPGGKYVYVASPGDQGGLVALQKNITLGEWVDIDPQRKNYWIVLSGLSDGDEVIVDGIARIFFPGASVEIAEPESKSSGTS